MTENPYTDRQSLTFEQAEGVEPLPEQLKTKEISNKLRARLWLAVYESIRKDEHYTSMGGKSYLGEAWGKILYDFYVLRMNGFADEFKNHGAELTHKVKTIIVGGDYTRVFGFLQFVLRHKKCPHGLSHQIEWALLTGHAAYRVLDGATIVPIGTNGELETLKQAFVDLAASEFHGARKHLQSAAEHLTIGDYASSIRESIHAVESVARTITTSGMLKDALASLEKSSGIHPALKSGFNSIYGYTNDQKGIRHPLLDDPHAKVDEADALFMIGACGAFISYVINKARLAGLLKQH